MTHHGVYQQSLAVMKKRGGGYSGMDIQEFYAMVEELFTPEEAEVNNAMPRGSFTAKGLSREMGREEADTERILESMADKGLCATKTFMGCQWTSACSSGWAPRSPLKDWGGGRSPRRRPA